LQLDVEGRLTDTLARRQQLCAQAQDQRVGGHRQAVVPGDDLEATLVKDLLVTLV
jgi:hypothetical protein